MKLLFPVLLSGLAVQGVPITSGSIAYSLSSTPAFAFSAGGMDVTGEYERGFLHYGCAPCRPGDLVAVYGYAMGSAFYGGTVTENSVTRSIDWGGSARQAPPSFLTFSGPSIAVTGPGSYASSFALTGRLCGGMSACDVLLDIIGSGTVAVNLTANAGILFMSSAVLTFNPPVQGDTISNPEPGAMIMTGIGLIALAMARRKR